VTFSKRYLFKLLGYSLDDKKFSEYVQKLGLELEGSSSEDFSIDVTPNRPDLLDIVGFARTLKNFMHKSSKYSYKIKDSEPALTIKVGKNVEKVRPFISALVVNNITLDETKLKYIIDFSEKFSETFGRKRGKLAMGMHDLSTISGDLTYDAKMEGKFTPLNMSKEMSFKEIMKNHDKGISYSHTIKGSMYPILSDSKGIMSLIPIINSNRTKITTNTKDLFVDITGTSEYITEKTADILAAMFMDLGGDVKKVKIIYRNKTIETPPMYEMLVEIPLSKIQEHIGVASIGFNNIISLANKMGYSALFINKKIKFRVPVYRIDVINEQDIIEDIAIAYGYDYIQQTPILSASIGKLDSITKRNKKLSQIMLGLGFSEALNNYLTNEETNFTLMNIKEVPHVQVKEAKTQNITMMRTWLLPSLLSNLGSSVHEKMPQKIFEIDMVFRLKESLPVESYDLACAFASSKVNFNDIKAIVEAVAQSFNSEYTLKPLMHSSFIKGRCAKIIFSNGISGFFGEINPQVLSNFGIEEPTTAFELEL
jgi:phenylalanyl-tRNA synthetase beta chain